MEVGWQFNLNLHLIMDHIESVTYKRNVLRVGAIPEL